jgi:UDP-glucuronate decarboxylase
VGSHLCTRLINEGHDVICLDNYFGDKKNTHLIGNPHFELVRHDITEPFFAEVDEIYNLACPASPFITNTILLKRLRHRLQINTLGLAKL